MSRLCENLRSVTDRRSRATIRSSMTLSGGSALAEPGSGSRWTNVRDFDAFTKNVGDGCALETCAGFPGQNDDLVDCIFVDG